MGVARSRRKFMKKRLSHPGPSVPDDFAKFRLIVIKEVGGRFCFWEEKNLARMTLPNFGCSL